MKGCVCKNDLRKTNGLCYVSKWKYMYIHMLISICVLLLATCSSHRGCSTSIDELRAGIVNNKQQPHDLTYVAKRT